MPHHKLIIVASTGLVNSKSQALNILGLKDDATIDDINKAFKYKARHNHPDVGGSTKDMQMIIAARDFLVELLKNEEEHVTHSSVPYSETAETDMSYEDIANMRKEMGRENFNKKFPGWENELKREMGLDEWNRIFEGYDSNHNPYDDIEQEQIYDQLEDVAFDVAHELFEHGMKDKNIDLYTNISNLIKQYHTLVTIPSWIQENTRLRNYFYKELKDKLNDLILDNVDDFNITIDDIISFPNEKIIHSFLSRDGNIENSELPNDLLSDKNFAISVISFIDKNPEKGKILINKYKNNKYFLDGILKASNFLYYIRNNINAKNLVLSLPFNGNQRKIVERWLDKE
jgi:curved DNA-binding protein CbpA